MNLRSTTREIIATAEEVSGFMVIVQEDADLQTISTVKYARGGLPGHVVIYKPIPGLSPDYQICFQCGFIIRHFSVPPEKRVDFVVNEQAEKTALEFIKAPKGIAQTMRLRKQQIESLAKQLSDGLMLHLRSIPIGLRVGDWLWKNYPELGEQQKSLTLHELEEAKSSLHPRILQMMPEGVTRPTLELSAAQALFWSDLFEQPELFNPYHIHGYSSTARKLIGKYFAISDSPGEDQNLIDGWAAILNLENWYNWIPYQPTEDM